MVVVVHISPRKAADVASVAGLPCGHGHRRTARCSAARAVRRQVTRRRGSVCGCAKTRERRRGSGVAEIPSGALLSCLTARRAHAGRAARGRPATPCELQRQSPNAARRVCRRLGAAGGYDWLWGNRAQIILYVPGGMARDAPADDRGWRLWGIRGPWLARGGAHRRVRAWLGVRRELVRACAGPGPGPGRWCFVLSTLLTCS